MIPDTGAYEQRIRGVNDEYAGSAATNAYSRFLSQQRGSRELGDMTQGFKRSFPSFGANFAQRGLGGPGVRSGVMQRSMQNYVGDYYKDFARQQQDMSQGLQQFDLEQARLDAWRTRSLADLEAEKAREIANAAQNIEALRPYLGGL